MPRALKIALLITDIAFLGYWVLSGLSTADVMQLPRSWLYAHYDDARVVAWNWSFLPLDVLFSVLGLSSVTAARRGSDRWRPLALVSLTLTVTAGGMAVGYWTLLREFDPFWFGSNVALIVWPMFFLPALIRDLSTERRRVAPGGYESITASSTAAIALVRDGTL